MRPALSAIITCMAVTLSQSPAQECTPQSVPYPQMGINFPGPPDMPWINLWHCMNPWHSTYGDNGITFGPDGWPEAGKKHNVRIGADWSMGGINEAGVHKMSFKGELSQILVSGGPVTEGAQSYDGVFKNLKSDYPEPGYSYLEIHCEEIPKTIGFTIDGHIEDVKIMRPGFELDETRTVHPKYTDLLDDYTTFRFMPYLASNTHQVSSQWQCEGPGSIDWEDRASPNRPQTITTGKDGIRKGGAWEWAVEACNELDKDMWINIPVIASDQYVRKLAEHLRSNLKPTLNVNIELGNELWNTAGGFCCFRQLQKHICGDDWGCHREWPGKRLKEVVDIFAEVFGWSEINNRIRAILCGQIGYGLPGDGWSIRSSLDYLEETYGMGTAHKYLYGVGAAPYFGGHGETVDEILAECKRDIDEHTFGEFSNEYHSNSDQYMGNKLEGWLAEAGQYGLKIYAYEGGPDMDYTTGAGGVKLQAMTDPRMKGLCTRYWNKWYSRYGYDALFSFFLGKFDSSGLYTLGEDMNGYSTRQAAMDSIMRNPTPAWDSTYRHVIPGTIDARKVSAYWSGWDRKESLPYLHPVNEDGWGGSARWTFAARKNGTYKLSIERQCRIDTRIDIWLDGVLVHDDLALPKTGESWGVWKWSADQGVEIPLELSYGIHVMKIVFVEENGGYKNLRFTLDGESPPFKPEEVKGNLNACLGNPMAKYYVDIDQSVCSYEWDETAIRAAGATLVPPAGGNGAVRTGQGTNTIYVDWSGVPEGSYNLRVRGTNLVGASPWRDFVVTVSACGFTMSPNPACINDEVLFTPKTPPGTSEWSWDFGPGSVVRTATDSTGAVVSATYTSAGSKAVKLTIVDSSGSLQSFINTLVVGQTKGGTADATPATVDAGQSAIISLSGHQGSVLRWQRSFDGTSYSDVSSADLPYTTGPMARTTWYRAVIKDGGCMEKTSSAAKVTVRNEVQPGAVSPDTTVCSGQKPGTLTLAGHQGTVVRWVKRNPPSTVWDTVSATGAATYTPGALSRTTEFAAVLSIHDMEFRSEPATITVTDAPDAVVIAGPELVCTGQKGVRYSVDTVKTATAYQWSVPSGMTIASGQGTPTIAVDVAAAAASGDISIAVTTSCGTGAPVKHAVKVGGITVAAVGYVDPTIKGANNGSVVVRLSGSPAEGVYQLDLNSDGTFEHNTALEGDSLVVSGFDDGETVTNVRVRPVGSSCASSVFSTTHTFKAQQKLSLNVPIISPGGGTRKESQLSPAFLSSSEDSLRTIVYRVCDDTAACTLTDQNKKTYGTATGLSLDISSGRKAIVFRAEPQAPYRDMYTASPTGSALYVYKPDFHIVAAWYLDRNADGRIDAARTVFDRRLPSGPTSIQVCPPLSKNPFKGECIEATLEHENERQWLMDFHANPFSDVTTGFVPTQCGRITDTSGLFVNEAFTINDSVAPVAVSATYTMAGEAGSGGYHDTLAVVLSEEAVQFGSTPFMLSGSPWPFELKSVTVEGTTVRAISVVPASRGSEAPHNGDSLHINVSPPNSISDRRGNVQSSSRNRRVALQVELPDEIYAIHSGPSLFDPVNDVFRVVVAPFERFSPLTKDGTGKLTVFDGMGNVVFSGDFEQRNNRLMAQWNGRNRSNRMVAQGTYVAVVEASFGGIKRHRRIKVGVDR